MLYFCKDSFQLST